MQEQVFPTLARPLVAELFWFFIIFICLQLGRSAFLPRQVSFPFYVHMCHFKSQPIAKNVNAATKNHNGKIKLKQNTVSFTQLIHAAEISKANRATTSNLIYYIYLFQAFGNAAIPVHFNRPCGRRADAANKVSYQNQLRTNYRKPIHCKTTNLLELCNGTTPNAQQGITTKRQVFDFPQ